MTKENFKPLTDLVNKINERIKNAPEKPNPVHLQVEPQMSLELWPNSVRGVPNTILRSSLFSINQRRLIAKKRELLSTVDGIEIRFKGERFNQTDLDVWEMLLHLARQQPLGNQVEFSAHSFLKELGRGIGQTQHEQLKEEIVRLRSGTVEITWKNEGKTFMGGLVEKAFRDEVTQKYVVVFDQKMLCLYEGGYSHVDWEQRNALGNNSLAKWLHGFYASHAAPFPYKVETIRTLCGSSNGELRGFRRDLKIALTELVEVGAIVSWEINKNDLVIIVKIPTSSQKKYMKNCKQ
jgi:TrfA protein